MITNKHKVGFPRDVTDRITFFDRLDAEKQGKRRGAFNYPQSEASRRITWVITS